MIKKYKQFESNDDLKLPKIKQLFDLLVQLNADCAADTDTEVVCSFSCENFTKEQINVNLEHMGYNLGVTVKDIDDIYKKLLTMGHGLEKCFKEDLIKCAEEGMLFIGSDDDPVTPEELDSKLAEIGYEDINESAINELNRSTETYTLPSHWAGYLINSDATGYSDEEIQEIDDFCDAHELGFCTGVSDDTWFQHGHDANRNQGADVADFTFSVDTPEAETYARVEESSYVPKKANKNKFNGKFRSKIKTFESFINELDDARYELDADDIKHMNTELTAEDFQLDDETYIKIMNEFGISEDQRKGETPKDAFEFFFSNILHAAKESGKLGELAKYSIHY